MDEAANEDRGRKLELSGVSWIDQRPCFGVGWKGCSRNRERRSTTRNTKAQKHERPPSGRPPCPGGPGTIVCMATAILPDNPPSRQVENAGFRQRRSYVACALPLCGGLSRPEGKTRPPRTPPRRRPPPSPP